MRIPIGTHPSSSRAGGRIPNTHPQAEQVGESLLVHTHPQAEQVGESLVVHTHPQAEQVGNKKVFVPCHKVLDSQRIAALCLKYKKGL